MTTVLNINDNNLLLHNGAKTARSQGYAWLKNGAVYFDFDEANNAVEACRLEPQQINSRYWQQCEQTALSGNDSGMRHAADLIWRHLSELRDQHQLQDVALVVPSHYQAANLQLLLGIANASGLNVTGLLNKAVVAVHAQQPNSAAVLHIDVQLHQSVCSEVVLHEGKWQLGKVEVMHEVGLQAMQDALLKAAQERFIKSDRFDPLHYAETEQQLFDQLPDLATSILAEGKANMVVVQSGNQHACSIDEKQWMAALQPYVAPLLNANIDVEPEHRLYDFNGFMAVNIAQPNREIIQQSMPLEQVLTAGSQRDAAGNVVYLTELIAASAGAGSVKHAEAAPTPDTPKTPSAPPANKDSEPAQATPAVSDDKVPASTATHLLHNGLAVPIGRAQIAMQDNALSISRGEASNIVSLLKSDQLFVMADAARKELRVNDRLGSNLADGVITVIRVE